MLGNYLQQTTFSDAFFLLGALRVCPNVVLVQPRKTCPFITERLLVGRKESNQTKTVNIVASNQDYCLL